MRTMRRADDRCHSSHCLTVRTIELGSVVPKQCEGWHLAHRSEKRPPGLTPHREPDEDRIVIAGTLGGGELGVDMDDVDLRAIG